MTDRYKCIRQALAMGATPGPWEVVGLSGCGGPYALRMPYRSGRTWYGVEWIKRREDAKYFAACDPNTIRALLDERDALFARAESDTALLRQALEALLGQRGEPDWHTGEQRENAIAALRERLGKCMEQKA